MEPPGPDRGAHFRQQSPLHLDQPQRERRQHQPVRLLDCHQLVWDYDQLPAGRKLQAAAVLDLARQGKFQRLLVSPERSKGTPNRCAPFFALETGVTWTEARLAALVRTSGPRLGSSAPGTVR